MNKNQRALYKSLEVIACATLTLEGVQEVAEQLTKDQIQEVIDKFTDKITEFDIKGLFNDTYNYETYANSILTEIAERLEINYS